MKHAFWALFVTSMGLNLVPLISAVSLPIIFDALFITAFTVFGLGLVGYTAPSDQFMFLGGFLSAGLTMLIGSSILQYFWPSPALKNIRLYGGIMLFCLYVLFDTQVLIENAKKKEKWDPINESLELYLDAINLFIKILELLAENSKN